MGGERLRILIEGWRGVPHSYCVVGMNYCRGLLERADCDVRFLDRPLWSQTWPKIDGVLAGDNDARVQAVPAPEAGWEPHVVLRTDFPMRLDPHPSARVVVTGTTEWLMAPPHTVSNADLHTALDGTRVRLATPSEWSRNGFLRSGAPARGVVLVPLGVDTALFRPPTAQERGAARATLGVKDEHFVFLSLGAMTDNKGVVFILAGFAQTCMDDPRAVLVLKGLSDMYESEGRVRRVLETLPAEAVPLVEQNTVFIGTALKLDDMVRLYHAADAYLAPYTAEGFCLPALEAAACGLPVLCTKGGPTDDFLPKGGTIFIASDREAVSDEPGKTVLRPRLPAVMDAMRRVMADVSLRKWAAKESPGHVQARYTWDRSTDLLLAQLRQ
ncbi:MAG: glycosyltransferase family 4 protein [Phycisphaerales bacterium]